MELYELHGWTMDVCLTAHDAAILARACEALADRIIRQDQQLELAHVVAMGAAMAAGARGAVARHVSSPTFDEEYAAECKKLGLDDV